jgi:porin
LKRAIVAVFLSPAPTVLALDATLDAVSSTEAQPAFTDELKNSPIESGEEGLSGNWGGLRTTLKDKGIDLQIKFKGDLVSNLSGGLERKTDALSNLDITADVDLDNIIGVPGLSLFVYGLGDGGANPTEYIGDSFGTSNIEAHDTFKVYELYFKEKWSEEFISIIGFRDLNADFYACTSSQGLVNSSFGISPSLSQTGSNGPSIFPNTALAATFHYQRPQSFYVQAGLFNANAGDAQRPSGTHLNKEINDGFLVISELGMNDSSSEKARKLAVGAWQYTDRVSTEDADSSAAVSQGLYVLIDQSLSENLSAFAKYGTASEVNEWSSAAEVGLYLSKPFLSRPEDSLSIGYAWARLSSQHVSSEDFVQGEAVIELNYSLALLPNLMLTPDFQYITRPGHRKDSVNAQVFSLRFEVSL